MADDPVDTKPIAEEDCKPQCAKEWSEYQGCVERIAKLPRGEAHCTGQYIDFWHCVDKCAVPKFWSDLK